MTTVRIVWKKLVHAAAWIADGLFALLAAAFTLPRLLHPRWHKAGRHAAPDDGQDWADVLRRIPSPLRKRVVPPVAGARVTAAVLGQMLRPDQLLAARHDTPDMTGPLVSFEGVPGADVDQYLTEHAAQYRAGLDRDHPELAGELIPPWPGPWIDGADVGAGFVVQPTLPPLPEPDVEYLPHACPDVPTGIWRYEGDDLSPELIEKFMAAWNAATQDVPGPAESASPAPPDGPRGSGVPRAVASAGPGTPPCVEDLDDTGWCKALTDWALYAPLDQVVNAR